MQSKRNSLIESFANVAVGYFVAVGSQMVVFPILGIHIEHRTNFIIGLIFTVISLVRSYLLRRLFNKMGNKKIFKSCEHPEEYVEIECADSSDIRGYCKKCGVVLNGTCPGMV